MDVKRLIEDLGGASAVARHLNCPVTTVQYWELQNRLPPWRQSVLEQLRAEHKARKEAGTLTKRRRKAA